MSARRKVEQRLERLEDELGRRSKPPPGDGELSHLTVGELLELKSTLVGAGGVTTAALAPDDRRRVEELIDGAQRRTDGDLAQLEWEEHREWDRLTSDALAQNGGRGVPDWLALSDLLHVQAARAVRARRQSST